MGQRIRLQRTIRQGGRVLKKGQLVELVGFPTSSGRLYTSDCYIKKNSKSYTVPKSVVAKSVQEKLLKKAGYISLGNKRDREKWKRDWAKIERTRK